MKLSLSWLFDHIDADWRSIDVPALVSLFNKTTAEIEGFDKISIDLKKLAAGQIKSIAGQTVVVEVPEWQHTIDMALRDDAKVGQVFLIANDNDTYLWAGRKHFSSEKEGLLSALKISQKDLGGAWKKSIEEQDVILHLDNKSVNHRPDMWGHRGVAREIAAMLNLPFKADDHLLISHNVKEYEKRSTAGKDHSFEIAIENPDSCKRFAGLYIEQIKSEASIPWMAARLAKVDSKPINSLVDITNYIMLDLGQPMHAFDVDKLNVLRDAPSALLRMNGEIIVRNAKNKEAITVLDGETLELTSDDCVVTDGQKPVALAGIMGGKESGVSTATQSIFLEAACFEAAVIRKTAMRVKKRSESSARFEKSLDPNQIITAIERYLKLLDENGIAYKASDPIIAVGKAPQQKTLEVAHTFIEQQLGVTIDSKFVVLTLEKLEFGVDYKNGIYKIVIPSFRATKDIAIKQDIVEEVGRFYGYDKIAEVLPLRQTKAFDLSPVMRKRQIKQLLAYSFKVREVYTYAFFDESFLNTINWQPGKTLKVQEAVSENWQRLVTSLMPNLFKAVHVHSNEEDRMNFFEWARIWPDGTPESERASLAGIFVNQKNQIDFYDIKLLFDTFARMMGMHFDWIKADTQDLHPWYLPYETAYLMCDGVKIGVAGKVNPAFFSRIAMGDAFIFELDGDFLLSHQLPVKRYAAASKYPGILRDVSMLVPVAITVKQLRTELAQVDPKITQVALMDFFEKPEWKDQKSLTFRISLVDADATMTTSQADAIMTKVNEYLQKQGAVIR